MLNGIDVSSNQPAGICSMVDYDFAIVKATGNPMGYAWNYVNPYMRDQVETALQRTGLAGLYHFTYGLDNPEAEARFFLDSIRDYIGRVMLVIDWEGDAVYKGAAWLEKFIKYIQAETGINPVIYGSASPIKQYGIVALAKKLNCGVWSANYWLGYDRIYGYDYSNCTNDVPEAMMWQYTSSGILKGYDSVLDLDVFMGDRESFLAYCSPEGSAGAGEGEHPPALALPDNVEELANNILANQYGINPQRKELLGDLYNGAQAEVDRRLGYQPDYEAVARDVWAGVWGDGEERKRRLGNIYKPVQKIVDKG